MTCLFEGNVLERKRNRIALREYHWITAAPCPLNTDVDDKTKRLLRSSSIVDPQTQWEKIVGNRQSKKILYADMVRSVQRGEEVDNVLLFGPPGIGKTMMLTYAAIMVDWIIIEVTQDAIMQTYQGQSEK